MVHEFMTASGILLRRDAVAGGYDDNHLARLVRRGVLVRARQGAYVRSDAWSAADTTTRHLLLCEAVQLQYDDGVAVSHDSAAQRHGGPTYGLDLSTVHLTHLGKIGGRRNVAGVFHHEGTCRAMDVTRDQHGWLMTPARTVLDVTMTRGLEAGIVMADDFLHRDLVSKDDLWLGYGCVCDWPGALVVPLLIGRADGRSESVGETLGRELFRRHHLPKPELQFAVHRPNGTLAGTSDWAWPEHGLLGEFDGKVKYHRLRRPGETIEQAVMREKTREDEMRELTGFSMIRLVWADLFSGEKTADRVRASFRKRAA